VGGMLGLGGKTLLILKKSFFNGLDNWFEHFLFKKLGNGE
jgi:hypothetical protein